MRERNLCMAARRAHIILRALELVRAGALIGGGKVRGDGYRGGRSPAKGRFAGCKPSLGLPCSGTLERHTPPPRVRHRIPQMMAIGRAQAGAATHDARCPLSTNEALVS